MHKLLAALLIALSANVCIADTDDDQAASFAKAYLSLCMKHLMNLDELREKLKPIPSLPAEKAVLFLFGYAGYAWPVPDKSATIVLALPSDKNLCAVYVRRANPEASLKLFTHLVATAPAPLVSIPVKTEQIHSPERGLIQTHAYQWSIPGAPLKLLFTLTTSASGSAGLQVLGSAAIIGQ
ncbi:NMCC_0638 family (lipo)protein [Pseudomonas faucium]|uniref:NMCC_0638 family (lipo)protein n=1 Tax=Pseudomonas faucium TaxID=2740518 RepID=UPI001596C219|nr:hypothetical protein [Pseudomonas faucium]